MDNVLRRTASIAATAALLALAAAAGPALAHPPDDDHAQQNSGTEHGTLAEIGAKLSNPVSNVWALFTEFDLTFYDGNANQGDPEVGSAMLFQPILPVPLTEKWKMIVRPTMPVVFTQPVPTGFDDFNRKGGLGDTLLPLLVSPAMGNWIIGVGPTFTLPTATNTDLGRQQWAMGPAGVVGYKTKEFVMGVFPQYFWKLADRGDQKGSTPDASYMSLLYFGFLNLPNAWQVGFNPSISYDHKASSGNKWNVPVGIGVTKTTKVGKMPVKFQFEVEYSVVSQDDFGKRALFKVNIIPVINALISKPIFGGG